MSEAQPTLTYTDVNILFEAAERTGDWELAERVGEWHGLFCKSKNRYHYGPLWECEKCGRVVCCAEGSDTDDWCDICWLEAQKQEMRDEVKDE